MNTEFRLRSGRFDLSADPHWFDLAAITRVAPWLHGRSWVVAPCVWARRGRGGRTIVTEGRFSLRPGPLAAQSAFAHGERVVEDPQWWVESADTRYGRRWEYRWDGSRLRINPAMDTPPDLFDQAKIQERLATILDELPLVRGMTGPFYKVGQ